MRCVYRLSMNNAIIADDETIEQYEARLAAARQAAREKAHRRYHAYQAMKAAAR